MGLAHSPNASVSGLKFAFDALNPKCNSSPYQNIGSGTSGSVINSPTYNPNGYYSFSGNEYIDYGNLPSFTMYAFEIWISQSKAVISSPETNFAPYYSCIGVTRTGFTNAGLNIGTWTGAMAGETVSWWSGYPVRYGTYIRDDIPVGFHHYFMNWNGSTYDIWIDGIQRTAYQSTDASAELMTGCTRITIGYNVGFNYYFVGDIGIVKAYETSFTSEQIVNNFNLYRGRFGV